MRPSPGAEDDGGNGDSIAEAYCDDREGGKNKSKRSARVSLGIDSVKQRLHLDAESRYIPGC